MRHQFGWDLLPGVSVKDIEDAQEDEPNETVSLRLAVGSLLDIISELTVALELGNKPDAAFTDTVVETIKRHKIELAFYD